MRKLPLPFLMIYMRLFLKRSQQLSEAKNFEVKRVSRLAISLMLQVHESVPYLSAWSISDVVSE